MFEPLLHAGSFGYSVYTLLMIATALAAATLGAIVVRRDEASPISWWFFAITASMGWWLLGRAMTSASTEPHTALIWTRFSYAVFPFLPPAFLQFTYFAIARERKPIPILFGMWSVSALLSLLALTTDQLIAGVIAYPWGYYPRYGPAGAWIIGLFLVAGSITVSVLVSTIRTLPPGRRRRRLQRFVIGLAIACVGMLDFIAAYGIPILPVGHFSSVAVLVIVGSAIRKFQLFDITPAFAAKNIVSTMPDALIVTDDEGHIRIVNDALCRLTGEKRSDLLTMSVQELLHRPDGGDALLRNSDGEPIPVSVSTSPLLEGGKHAGNVIIAHDMRERRRIELAMLQQEMRLRTEEVRREAELQFRTLVESMSEGIVQVDTHNIVRYANDCAAEITGTAPSDIIGRDIGDLFDGRLRDLFVTEWGPDASSRTVTELNHSGISRWIEVVRSPIVDASGLVIGSIAVLNDITERRRFEHQLQMSEREWRETFDAIPSPLVIVDAEGIVHRANRAARELAGNREPPVPLAEFGTGDLWREIAQLLHAVDDSAHVQYEEKDTRHAWDIIIDVIAREPTQQIVVSARDITAFVELQRSLRRSETMSALGALVGGVAHEVRNPLFAISSTLDAFEKRHGSRSELRGFLGVLREQITRLTDLMAGLLELGRPAPIALATRPLEPIVRNAIALCATDALAAGVEIRFESRGTLPAVVVDEKRLLQAFRNIIHNAVQYSQPEAVVHVRIENGRFASGAPAVSCKVFDEGSGFDPEDVPHVFDPFFTRRKGGTGLGLSITRAVVEQHHGVVSAGNRAEGGAIVSVTLPVVAEGTE